MDARHERARARLRVWIEDSMSNWRQNQPKVWRWRVRGRSSDRRLVTLGKYDTENEARADHDRILREGFYCSVIVEQLTAKDQQ
jgi:hypothetical protein